MKKVFFISMLALSLGVCAFFVTLVKIDNTASKRNDIIPIKVETDKKYEVAESSIRINPQVLEQKETNSTVVSKSDVIVAKTVNAKPKKVITFAKPCSGEILMNYAKDNMVYSNTLREWVVHDGVDFKLNENDPVFSVCDGNVIDIRYEHKLGNIIEIENEEYVVKYACVEAIKNLKVGDSVKQGMQIAVASSDVGFEQDDGVHLHLEIFKNGNQINPSEVI